VKLCNLPAAGLTESSIALSNGLNRIHPKDSARCADRVGSHGSIGCSNADWIFTEFEWTDNPAVGSPTGPSSPSE
jgi:hypothetical protein